MEASQTIGWDEMAKVALAFCEECRGWKNPYFVNDWGNPYILNGGSSVLSDSDMQESEYLFRYRQLGAVMAAVRDWLKPVSNIPAHHAKVFVHVIPDVFSQFFVGVLDEAGLCHALMAACVDANRGRQRKTKHA